MEVLIILAIIAAVVVSSKKNQQANEQRRKQEQARAAFEQRAAQTRVPEGQSAMWGTPDHTSGKFSGEGGTSGDPFCQGPAGSFSSSEGIGSSEGRFSAEGMGELEGRMRSGEGEDVSLSPRLKVVSTMVKAHDTMQAVQASPDTTLSFDSKAVVQGILYAEILGKPKALRKG